MVLTFIPAAILNALTEIFGWRPIWLHLFIALLLAACAGLPLAPDWFSAMTFDRLLITIAVLLSALVAGIVYRAIAGQFAGMRRETISVPAAPS